MKVVKSLLLAAMLVSSASAMLGGDGGSLLDATVALDTDSDMDGSVLGEDGVLDTELDAPLGATVAAIVADSVVETVVEASEETAADVTLLDKDEDSEVDLENTVDATVAATVADGLVDTVVTASEETSVAVQHGEDGITDVDGLVENETHVAATAEVAGHEVEAEIGICLEGTVEDTTNIEIGATITNEKPNCVAEGGGGGDPHFKRWGKERDTFHGECDLVVVHSESFHNKGLDLHVRTTSKDWYSYIEAAAVRVGDDIVEVANGVVVINGLSHMDGDLPALFGNEIQYSISLKVENNKKHYTVTLGDHSNIVFRFWKHYMTFKINAHTHDFDDANGILGAHPSGAMVGRAGELFADFADFAFEWQVNQDDPQLFDTVRGPQLPYEKCRMPTKARPSRRHLRSNRKLLAEAEQACDTQNGRDFELCVEDVVTTGEVELAHIW